VTAMRRRLSARAIKLVSGGKHDPIVCIACGGTVYAYEWAEFAMLHVSTCKACGLPHRCELKPSPPRKPPPNPQPPDYGYGPYY